MSLVIGQDSKGRAKGVLVTDSGSLKVSVTGNEMELYGADTSTRPLASAVPVGKIFVVVASPMIVYMSDGTNWIEVP